MRNIIYKLLILVLYTAIANSFSVLTASDDKEIHAEIISGFKRFKELEKKGKFSDAKLEIKKAYKLSDKHFSRSKLTASLLYNYAEISAKIIDHHNRREVKKLDVLLHRVIKKYIEVYGEESVDLVDAYMLRANFAMSNFSNRKFAVTYYNDAFDIARKNNKVYPLLFADISLEAGIALLRHQYFTIKGKEFIESALDNYKKSFAEQNEKIALCYLWLAKYYFEKNANDQSIAFLDKVIDYHKSTKTEYHPRLIQAYSLLIAIYESTNETEKADYYSQEIGRSVPWVDEQDAFPIFTPVITVSGFSAGLSVQFELHISKTGKLKDAIILTLNGKKEHAELIRESLLKWRFSPKFEEGEAVDSVSKYTFDVSEHVKPMIQLFI